MIGASRESFASLRETLDGLRGEADFAGVADDLLAVSDLLGRDRQLRAALADSGQVGASRGDLVKSLLGGRICPTAERVVAAAANSRWSSPADLLEGLEGLAAQAVFIQAEADGTLDAVEAELFGFRQAVSNSSTLQMALTDPASDRDRKAALVSDLLSGRSQPATRSVLTYAMSHLRGRPVDGTVADLMVVAAEQRGRFVAEVRAARDLDQDQRRRLAAALSKLAGRQVRLNVAVDPTVVGGAVVRIGNDVIDGSVASRLRQAQRTVTV